jgi:hypothetical protein
VHTSYVFWFATNDVGWARLNKVVLPAGTTLQLAHAEQMRLPNGTVCLVGCEAGTAYYAWGGAVDTYTLRGGALPACLPPCQLCRCHRCSAPLDWPGGLLRWC